MRRSISEAAGRGLAPRAGIRPPGNARSGSMAFRSARRAGFANQHPNVPTTGGGVPENDAREAAARRARLAPLAFRIAKRAASTARRASPRPATRRGAGASGERDPAAAARARLPRQPGARDAASVSWPVGDSRRGPASGRPGTLAPARCPSDQRGGQGSPINTPTYRPPAGVCRRTTPAQKQPAAQGSLRSRSGSATRAASTARRASPDRPPVVVPVRAASATRPRR